MFPIPVSVIKAEAKKFIDHILEEKTKIYLPKDYDLSTGPILHSFTLFSWPIRHLCFFQINFEV